MALYYKKNYFAAHKKKYNYYALEDLEGIKNSIPDFNKHGLLLDLACGSGVIGEYVNSLFPKLKIVGIDHCYQLLQWSAIDVCLSDACLLPFKDESFDCILAIAAFHHFSSLENAVKECSRCLKSKGIFLCVEPNKYHPQRFIMMTDPLRYLFYKNGDHAISARQFKKLLIKAHFKNIHMNYLAFKGKHAGFLASFNYAITHKLLKQNKTGLLQFVAPWFQLMATKA